MEKGNRNVVSESDVKKSLEEDTKILDRKGDFVSFTMDQKIEPKQDKKQNRTFKIIKMFVKSFSLLSIQNSSFK